jgi:nitroimidazol reductase NimA-like FMN-containing flavoprotein (pyridoxamine 5'-phosphate oxidase superfamily)
MRKKEKEIKAHEAIESIIQKSLVCRLALSEGNRPYIIPLCFGYQDHTLYFHCAREGRKIDILRKNPRVCFEFDIDHELVTDEQACKFDMKYRSVIGFGKASLVEDPESKRRALDAIMSHYTGKIFTYPDDLVAKTGILKVEIENLSGKKAGY